MKINKELIKVKYTYLTMMLSDGEHTMELLGELSVSECMGYCRKLRLEYIKSYIKEVS